ncbi:MAG: tape measure protein [Pseudomonadota bacterium]
MVAGTKEARLRFVIDSSDAREAARDIDRLADETDRAGRETDQLASSSQKAGSALRGLTGIVAALIGALATREVLEFASAWQETENRLRLVTDSTEELVGVQNDLIAVAQGTFNSFSATANTYAQLARSTEELNISSSELIAVTETINQTIALSGTTAQSAAAALFQFRQGIAAGALRGQELNSVLEQTPELARAIAEGLGVSIGELRELGEEGQLTAERVIGAIQNQAEAVAEDFNNLEPTIGQIQTALSTAFQVQFITPAKDELAEFTDLLADPQTLRNIEAIGETLGRVFEAALGIINQTVSGINEVINRVEIESLTRRIRAVEGLRDDAIAERGRLSSLSPTERVLDNLGSGVSDPLAATDTRITSLNNQIAELTDELKDLIDPVASASRSLDDLGESSDRTATSIEGLGGSADDAEINARGPEDAIARAVAAQVQAVEQRILSGVGVATTERLDSAIIEELKSIRRNLEREDLSQSELLQLSEALNDQTERLQKAIRDAGERDANDQSDFFEDLERFSAGLSELTRSFDLATRGIERFRDESDNTVERLASLAEGVGFGLEGVLGGLQGGIAQLFGSGGFTQTLGQLGSIFGAVGQFGAFVSTAVGLFSAIFGRESSNEAGLGFNTSTGNVTFIDQDGSDADENAQVRDEIFDNATAVIDVIRDLTGANSFNDPSTPINEGGISIGVRNDDIRVGFGGASLNDPNTQFFENSRSGAEEAVDEVIKLFISSLEGGEQELVDFAQAAAGAGRPLEEIVDVLDVLSQVLDENKDALTDYAVAAAQAGRDAQEIAEGVDALNAVLELAAEPLSDVESALKTIDDAVNPVIEDLQALGLSIDEIGQVAIEAARAVGVDFVRQLEQDILDFTNSTVGAFNALIEGQEQILSDAQALLDRGAITPEEFDLVQVRNALEREQFFAGLSPDELETLGDFFGVIEDSGGAVALVLTQLTSAFNDFVDNVGDTRDALQDEADQLRSVADAIFSTRDAIDLRFPSQSGGELLQSLRSELLGLREGALAGDNTAFEQIPDVANRLVDLGRDLFGSTSQFAEVRDFALSILDQTGGLADSRSNKLLSEIEALNTQVDALNDIRDILASPDPSVELLQSQLDQGNIQTDLIRELLAQYIELTQEAQARRLTPEQAQRVTESFFETNEPAAGSGTVQVARFDESVTILSEIRDQNRLMSRYLKQINQEQTRSRASAALTG